MPRPKRHKIKFDEESLNKLLQEIYDDTFNIRAQIKRLFLKWETKVKEEGEIAAFGDQVIKLINAEAKNQDQKIMLLKYLKDVVFDKNSTFSSKDTKSNNIEDIDDEERRALIRTVQEELKKNRKDS